MQNATHRKHIGRRLTVEVSPTPGDRREYGTAWRLRYQRNETVEEGTKRILAALTDEMIIFLDHPEEVGVDTTIHEVRRRGKQARALLRLVRPAIRGGFKDIDRLYRDAGRLLAPARDARIVVDALDDLGMNDAAAADIRSSLEDRAAIEAQAVFDGEDGQARNVRELVGEAVESARGLEIPDEACSVGDGAARIYTEGQNAYSRASQRPSANAFHTWRKRVKQRRHHLSYLWDCTPIDSDAPHERLCELSDLLGAAHDFVVFREHLADMANDDVPDEASQLIIAADRTRVTLETRALQLGDVVYEEVSTAIAGTHVANWQTWKEPYR
jgi:CHAD domain-containing protein